MNTSRNAVAASVLALLAFAGSAVAGPLNPPAGAVGTSMKTLTEVEPRIAINATNTPGDGSSVFVINQVGSYYLTGNLAVAAAKNGIKITASHVTIDLNGFTVYGFPGSLDGITTNGVFQTSLKVHNGTVRTFGDDGIDLASASTGWPQAAVLENLQVTDNGDDGATANDATVRGCTFQKNSADGLLLTADHPSSIEGCVSTGNSGHGIYGQLVTLTGCNAAGNTGTGIGVWRGLISNSTSHGNGTGIFMADGSITGCTATGNTSTGIYGSGMVKDNIVNGGDEAVGSVGIKINGGFSRVEGNVVSDYATGIHALFSGNTIVRNTLASNTKAMVAPSGNRVGALIALAASGAINGNTGGGLGTSDPLANLVY